MKGTSLFVSCREPLSFLRHCLYALYAVLQSNLNWSILLPRTNHIHTYSAPEVHTAVRTTLFCLQMALISTAGFGFGKIL